VQEEGAARAWQAPPGPSAVDVELKGLSAGGGRGPKGQGCTEIWSSAGGNPIGEKRTNIKWAKEGGRSGQENDFFLEKRNSG